MQTKEEMRSGSLAARKNMPLEEVTARSGAILARLRTVPEFCEAETVLCYVSSKDNEVDTHGAIRWLLAAGRTVFHSSGGFRPVDTDPPAGSPPLEDEDDL